MSKFRYLAAFLYLHALSVFARRRHDAPDHRVRVLVSSDRRLEGAGDQLAAFNASGAPPTVSSTAFDTVQESHDDAQQG